MADHVRSPTHGSTTSGFNLSGSCLGQALPPYLKLGLRKWNLSNTAACSPTAIDTRWDLERLPNIPANLQASQATPTAQEQQQPHTPPTTPSHKIPREEIILTPQTRSLLLSPLQPHTKKQRVENDITKSPLHKRGKIRPREGTTKPEPTQGPLLSYTPPMVAAAYPKRPFTIATFNVQSMAYNHRPVITKLECLVNFCKQQNIDAIALQEHHIVPTTEDKILTLPCGWTFIYTPATPIPQANGSTGGVGWLLSPRTFNAIREVLPISPRILAISITLTHSSPITLLSVYAPTAQHPEQRRQFWNALDNTIQHRTRYLIAGDLNTVLAHGDDGPWGAPAPVTIPTTHARDELVTFLKMHNFRATSTWFHKPGLFTFTSPTNESGKTRRTVLDYILTPSWVRTHNIATAACPIPSDHNPVVIRLALPRTPPPPQRSPPNARPDFSQLYLGEEEEQQNARNTFITKFTELFPNHPTAATYPEFSQALLATTDSVLPKTTPMCRVKHNDDPHIVDAQRDFYNSSAAEVPQPELRRKYKELINKRNDIIDKDVEQFCSMVDKYLVTSGKAAYKALKTITYRHAQTAKVSADNTAERLKLIKEKCQQQLSNPHFDPNITFQPHQEINPVMFDLGPFTSQELQKALQSTPRGKAPGPDGIFTDLLKIPELQPHLLSLLNDCWTNDVLPTAFKCTKFAMLPKPGAEHTKPEGWRYIALMSAVAKIYDKLLLQRLSSVVEPHLRPQQNGFRPKRNTIQHCMTLRHLIDEATRTKTPAILTFIDFSNAFPSVSWKSIEAALTSFQVPQKLIAAILRMYHDHTAFVQTNEGPTETFSPTAGVLQGDTLAPFLFLLVLNEVLRLALHNETGFTLQKAFREPGQRAYTKEIAISDLDYADDIVLLCHTITDAQRLLQKVADSAKTVGLFLNVKKTQHIRLNTPATPPLLLDKHQVIAAVESYRYLGVWTDVDKDISVRLGQAWAEHAKYSRIWHSPNITPANKVHLWRTMISPILLYGAPTYPETTKRYEKLRGTCTRMLRSVLNLHYDEHATLSDIYGKGLTTDENSFAPPDIPQLTTSIFLRQGKLLFSTFTGPKQPFIDILKTRIQPTDLRRQTPSIMKTLEDHFRMDVDEMIKLFATPKQWKDHMFECALEHEAHIYQVRQHKRSMEHMRQHINKAAPEHLLSLDSDVPLIECPLAQFKKLRTYDRKLTYLQQYLPADHPLSSATYTINSPALGQTTHTILRTVRMTVHRDSGAVFAIYGNDDPSNQCIYTQKPNQLDAIFEAILHILQTHQAVHLRFLINNKQAITILNSIAEKYLSRNQSTTLFA